MRGTVKMRRPWPMAIAFSGGLLLAACASSTQPPLALALDARTSPIPADGSRQDYRLGPGDLLQIDVFQAKELSRKARVRLNGDLSIPLIGVVRASGLTAEQLETVLASKLEERYLQDPKVSVFIEEFTSQRVTVEGQVTKPGVYPLTGGHVTLLQTIAMAGGPEEIAATKAIQVFRTKEDGSKEMHVFDIDAIRAGDSVDPGVNGDDVIVVREDKVKAFTKGFTDTIKGLFHFGASVPLF